MTCERCSGLMVHEQICDMNGTGGDGYVDGYRCLLCGDLVDAVVPANRRRSAGSRGATLLKDPRRPRLVAA